MEINKRGDFMLEKSKSYLSSLTAFRKCVAILLATLVVGTVIFIFSNSIKSPVQSTEQSDGLKETISQLISPDTMLGSFIIKNIRKIAHFAEYGLLGIEVTLLVLVLAKRRKVRLFFAAKSIFFALVIAFIDETIQIFSGRGPAVSDVWIDIGGFFICTLITVLATEAALLARRISKSIFSSEKRKSNGKDNRD